MCSYRSSKISDSDNTKSFILSWLESVQVAIHDSLPLSSSHSLPPTSTFVKRPRQYSLSQADHSSPLHLSPRKRRCLSESIATKRPLDENLTSPITPQAELNFLGSEGRETSDTKSGASSFTTSTKLSSKGLTARGLIRNDHKAFDRYPKFQEKIYNIVHKHRAKNPNPTSEKKLQLRLQEYYYSNQNTLLWHLMPILLKDGYYTTKLRPELSERDRANIEHDQAVFKDFLIDEGIVVTRNEQLYTSLPNKSMDQGLEMKNVELDFIFGITPNRFPIVSVPEVIDSLLVIAPGMFHPFLIIQGDFQGEGDQESMLQAKDRCRLGGSTLVHATRTLNKIVFSNESVSNSNGESIAQNSVNTDTTAAKRESNILQSGLAELTENADSDTFVFSVTISTQIVKFYVNWYENNQNDLQGDPQPLFHMNLVKSVAFKDHKALQEIRHTLHNICEWGANDWANQFQKLHESLSK